MDAPRLKWIDHCRALAILWMILFHFTYDLRLFGLPSLPSQSTWYWEGFPRLIVATFMFSMGLSLDFAKAYHKLTPKRFWTRWFKIAGCAALVSLGTWLSVPHRWVYFGTLHSIATCSLLVWPFLNRPRTSFILAVLILGAHLLGYSIPWLKLPHPSMDYIPPFPWLAWVLFGVSLRQVLSRWKIFQNWPEIKLLSLMGRHSLAIYLLHQPVLVSCTWVISKTMEVFDGA